MSTEEHGVIFLEGMREGIGNNEDEMAKTYDHPLHAEYEAVGTRGGHGGMDWLVCRAFIESVKNGTVSVNKSAKAIADSMNYVNKLAKVYGKWK